MPSIDHHPAGIDLDQVQTRSMLSHTMRDGATNVRATTTARRDPDFTQRLRECRFGVSLSVLTILFGFLLGGVLGALEDTVRADLTARAETVSREIYGGDTAAMKAVTSKSYGYYQRAHLHGGAIGAAALGSIVLLAALRRPRSLVRRGCALALGVGALGYSLFWLLAARAAPVLGSTAAAKESLRWLALPAAGLLLLGIATVLTLTIVDLFAPPLTHPRA